MNLEPITIIRCQWRGTTPRHFFIAFLHNHSEIPLHIGKDADFEKSWLESDEAKLYTFGLGNTAGSAQRAMYRAKREYTPNLY